MTIFWDWSSTNNWIKIYHSKHLLQRITKYLTMETSLLNTLLSIFVLKSSINFMNLKLRNGWYQLHQKVMSTCWWVSSKKTINFKDPSCLSLRMKINTKKCSWTSWTKWNFNQYKLPKTTNLGNYGKILHVNCQERYSTKLSDNTSQNGLERNNEWLSQNDYDTLIIQLIYFRKS